MGAPGEPDLPLQRPQLLGRPGCSKLLDRGGFDLLFLADSYGYPVLNGATPDVAFEQAVEIPKNDPMLLLPAMASHTSELSFAITTSTTFEHPYANARRLATLDHLTGGRLGWNVVTTKDYGFRRMLRTEHLPAPAAVTAAFGATTRATVGIIAELNRQIGELEAELSTHFEAHPDADIYRSLPGLGVILGARVLGEFGDDPNRYTTAKCRKNYAGTSPLTIASGRKRAVLARHVRNRRLYDAVDLWAFCALQASPGARIFYDEHRAAGDLHHQAAPWSANCSAALPYRTTSGTPWRRTSSTSPTSSSNPPGRTTRW